MKIRINSQYLTADNEIDTALLKQDVDLAQIAGWVTDLKPCGGELRGLCPLHDEKTPSFYVNQRKQVWHCHGCGQGGDVIDFVMMRADVDFVSACEWLAGSERTCPPRALQSVEEARRIRHANVERAKTEWRNGVRVEGTVAQTYLASRGILGNIPGCIRFGMVPSRWEADGSEGPRRAAMISAVQSVDGGVVGIQRLFLDAHGRKVRWSDPRLSLGQIRGGAVRLSPLSHTVMLTTGVEDGLALLRMFPGATVWVALGDANLPHVHFPDLVERVLLCGDADDAGHAAVEIARKNYDSRRLDVDAVFPAAGKDFAEEWLALHHA